MFRYMIIFALIYLNVLSLIAGDAIKAGPMLAYNEMREVGIWVQTKYDAKVWAEYNLKGEKYSINTNSVQSDKDFAYTATLIADSVQPGKEYEYRIYVDGVKQDFPYPTKFKVQTQWQYREPVPTFKFAAGSCYFRNEEKYDRNGKAYGGEYEIFESIHTNKPDFMLWLGDNVYLREPDWHSRTGILHRYTHQRELPELQPLLASCFNYAIWDDHDFGPNDSDKSFRNKNETLEAFKLFFPNSGYGRDGFEGITNMFTWADLDFFLLDNRYNRTANNFKSGKRELLGEAQIEWLINALSSSKATFKIICIGGQTLNPVAKFENYAIFPEERKRLLELLELEGIKGVFFLSGDRHFSELTKMERLGSYPLYDLTVSPLTSGAWNGCVEENYLRVEGTCVGVRNFAVIEVGGEYKNRYLKIEMKDSAGKLLWTTVIPQNELGWD